jgi:endoglucanase
MLVAAGVTAVTLAGCSGGGSGGSGGSSGAAPTAAGGTRGAVVVPRAVGSSCPAGDPGKLAGTPVALEQGVPAGPAPNGPLYVTPASNAATAAHADPAHAALYRKIAGEPDSFTVGDWLTDVRGSVNAYVKAATRAHATAMLMIYAIPHRDAAAGFSAGGEPTAAAYRAFTRKVAKGIGDSKVIIVLEPDSLGQITSLPAKQQSQRYSLLRDAVDVYGKLPGASVYLDGANCGWTSATDIASRLRKAGIAHARGFAVNVANFYWTSDEAARAHVISALTGGAHFVIDTSRNGRGPLGGEGTHWCNPPGRGLGARPTTSTGDPLDDAYLWVKTPGESDGACGQGEPTAGTWWPAQALELARNASW